MASTTAGVIDAVELSDLSSSTAAGAAAAAVPDDKSFQPEPETNEVPTNWQGATPAGGAPATGQGVWLKHVCSMWLRTLSPRQMVGMAFVPVIVVVTIITEESHALKTPEQHRLAGVLCLVSVLYLSEAAPLPVTGLMIGPLITVFRACKGGKKCETVALPPYFEDVIFLLLGSGFLATSMQLHGVDQRLVQWMTNLPCARGNPMSLRVILTFTALFMAFVLSAPAMMAVFLPILLNLSGAETGQMLADPSAELMLKGNIFCVLYAVLAGCMSTKLSPSVVAATNILEDSLRDDGIKHVEIGLLQYCAVGIPAAMLVTLLGIAVTYGTLPSGAAQHRGLLARPSLQRTCSARWSWGEIVTNLCWCWALLLWILPSVSGTFIFPFEFKLANGAAAMLGSVPLFLVPDVAKDCRSPVLPWDAAMKGTGWSSLFLAGGGLSLGRMLMQTGLAKLMASKFLALTNISSIFMLTAVTCVMTTFTTEFLANMAAINLMTPIVYSMGCQITCDQGCGDPGTALIPSLVVPMAASCSFMMPWASPMNAAAYQSGHVPMGQMMKYGFWMNILSAVVLVLWVIRVVPWIWPPGVCTLAVCAATTTTTNTTTTTTTGL